MTDLRSFVKDVPDFPEPGVLFRDITPLLASPLAFQLAIHEMAKPFRDQHVQKVLGIEARGFMFGAALARELSVGFVPMRKPGKLPRETVKMSYGLEYGKDCLELHKDALEPDEHVLIADDVLATGGTAEAAVRLVEQLGARVDGLSFLIELGALAGRGKLGDRRVHAVLLL
jgi:adenine phosphoribosyltransferase